MMVSHTPGMPSPVSEEQVIAGGDQPDSGRGNRWSAFLICVQAICALVLLSPSALFTAMASAISIIPRLMPCSSSPAPEIISSRKKSTMECTAISDWPTPTVSTIMVSNPAASQIIMVSLVLRATPPSEPAEGEGRINALGWVESPSIRVLSPKMLPLERELLGSMASTASL